MTIAVDIEPKVSNEISRCIRDEEIPVIDVGNYLNGDIEAREQLAIDLRAIQESLGFYVIVNHGVEQSLIDRSFEQVADLFSLPLDTKLKYRVDFHHIGYIPDKATVLRWSKIADNQKKDKNEAWAFMRERGNDDPKVIDNVRHRGMNKWPEELPDFKPIILSYQETMADLAQKMLPVYSRALDLPSDYFDKFFSMPQTSIRS